MTIGDQILDLIIRDGLVRAEHINGNTLFIWQGNAAEQLEALVENSYQVKRVPMPAQQIVENMLASLDHADELRALSHRELIDRTLECDAADYSVVIELMNRVLPGWEK